MQAADLTLAAALRDESSDRAEARAKAVRNLAPALLEELGVPGPRWNATEEHARGADVRRALSRALEDDDPALRGLAAVGLGTLGDADVIRRVQQWLLDDDADEAIAFLRQCAVIAMSLVGASAPRHDPRGADARREALSSLREAMRSPLADVRFQAAIGLVEVGDATVERELVDALDHEEEPAVRENLVAALSLLDPPGKATCARMRLLLQDDEEASGAIGLEAALLLAAARDPAARPRLMAALHHRGERDRALEALAVLGAAPADDQAHVQRLATSVWTPGVTRVRAAYALARMHGAESGHDRGRALLSTLRFHPRGAVREAVRDAMRLLDGG